VLTTLWIWGFNQMKKFLIYALILGSFGYAMAQSASTTISNRKAAIEAALGE
jgi:hypothetical protein